MQIEQERHSWLKFSILLLFILLWGFLNVIGSQGDANLNMDDPQMLLLLKILQAVSVIILFILPAVLFAVLWTKPKLHYLGITTRPALLTILFAGIGMLMAMPLINWIADLNQHMQLPSAFSGIESWMKTSEAKAAELTAGFTKGTSIGVLLINLFVIAFMAALSEEIFFRGLFQKVSIECLKNKHVGVWFAAIIFSAFHMQFYGFVPRVLMGAYLGYLFLWSGSLWPGIVAHFLNNGMAVFLIWLVNRGTISPDIDKVGIQQSEMIYVVFSFVMVVISLILVYRIEKKRKLQALLMESETTKNDAII